ncbi:hypothetical protein EH243_05955 [Amphritea opalescens]|uniref:Uncharacterized protein n=1 Tax=Amphritea opalescens TaxID=2490544 RepID=A0A430KSV4_9GAMM|nr:hypothetical protein [Amphritea opalescens]RTE66625.1 hypothetical protein EH243_05955 [Amphritea opalescens]
MSAFYRLIIALTLPLVAQQALAIQLTDPRSAAVYLQQQRPLINACLQEAQANTQLPEIWASQACQQLLAQDPQLKTAWQLILPNGTTQGLAQVPYGLRQLTVDTYSEYKQLAERIAQLSR